MRQAEENNAGRDGGNKSSVKNMWYTLSIRKKPISPVLWAYHSLLTRSLDRVQNQHLQHNAAQLDNVDIDTNIYTLVVSPFSEDGQIYLNPTANLFRLTFTIERQSASTLLKPTFILSSSTCLIHVLFGLNCFL